MTGDAVALVETNWRLEGYVTAGSLSVILTMMTPYI
jgi:hypothetical protein